MSLSKRFAAFNAEALRFSLLLIVLVSFPPSTVVGTDLHDAYAAPMTRGPRLYIRGHIGAATYRVEVRPQSKATKVIGRVTYFADDVERPITREFVGSITFRTGNVTGRPVLRFKGIPTGTTVTVRVD